MMIGPSQITLFAGGRSGTRVGRALALAIALVGVLTLAATTETASAAGTRPLTVTITHVSCVDDCNAAGLEADLQGHADFYAKVWINGVLTQTPRCNACPSSEPFWQVPAQVPDDLQNVPVGIQIWDYDVSSGDDLGDASPRDGDNNLDFTVNYETGTWSDPTGDGDKVNFPQACSTGDGGANDEPRIKVCFDISTTGDGDTDDDGIPDGVERFGMPDANGNLVPIPRMKMDPCRKTIALEIDWMAGAPDGHSHRPTDAALSDAITAMNAAPVAATMPCPYGGFPTQASGVNLVIDRSNSITELPVFTLDDLPGVRDGGNFLAARRPYMHYVLAVHDQAKDDSTSGICCRSNKDLLMSLGSWSKQVGTYRDQSGTILHELGHSLALGHGGDEGTNFKPNYLSVMNYAFGPTGIPDPTIPANIDTNNDGTADQSFRLDYSRSKLDDLDEASLSEPKGIGDGTDMTSWWDPGYQQRSAAGNVAVDWNWVNGGAETAIKVDLNRDFCIDRGKNGKLDTTPVGDDKVVANLIAPGSDFVCNTTASGDDEQNTPTGRNVLSTLVGYDDWKNVKYRAGMSVSAGGAANGHDGDITFEQAEEIKQATFALFSPDLALAKTVDRTQTGPGETLTYTVTTRNVGLGAAKSVEMLDTLPDGSTATRSLGVIAAGGAEPRTLTYDVPCTTADGATVTNSAGVTGTNLLNNPEVNTTNNSASVSSTVHAPALTLAATATASSVRAGEAITLRLLYENTGSGEARSANVSATLPADVYYSTALDQGAGPDPTSVTRIADGTTVLSWSVGSVAGGSGPQVIEYTARPSLLFSGSSIEVAARLTFTNAGDCTYAPVTASHSVAITAVPPTRNPLTQGYWKTHPEEWTSEILARIQATDQRYDGADGSTPDGRLTSAEVTAALAPGGTPPKVLRSQLLATYFNLATRRVNAATAINSKTDARLALRTVRDAARYAIATLTLPVGANSSRYSDAIRSLDEINSNTSEIY